MENPIARATNTYPDDPSSCVGKWIKINDTIGQIFCLEPIVKVVILQTKNLDFVLFTFDSIDTCQVAKPKRDLPLFYMDLEQEQKLVQKVKKSEEKQIEKYKKIGVGVSNEAQIGQERDRGFFGPCKESGSGRTQASRNLKTFFITTGTFPQVFILTLPQEKPIKKIIISSRKVQEWVIYYQKDKNYELFAEQVLEDLDGIQTCVIEPGKVRVD
ncbi:hypothetical protein HDV01_005737 [Terramyces sp. JEL0728]|nr:hypothetical protein HDV01_005737 [Terramyces sp. JEL0728]